MELDAGSVGSFTWLGAGGTYFWIDPAEQLVAVQLIQVTPGASGPFINRFRNLTYGAFRVPDQGVAASSATPVTIEVAALAAYAGTYTFSSTSSRDRQEPSMFGGLGIDVRMQNGGVKVVSAIPNAPAAKAGVQADDFITHLDDDATQGMTLDQAVDKMRGPVNTRIRLRVVRKGHDEPIELTIARAVIRPQGAGAELHVAVKDGRLQIEASGDLAVLEFEKGAPITVVASSSHEFFVDGGDHTRLAFLRDEDGPTMRLMLNPGPWQTTGQRIN